MGQINWDLFERTRACLDELAICVEAFCGEEFGFVRTKTLFVWTNKNLYAGIRTCLEELGIYSDR